MVTNFTWKTILVGVVVDVLAAVAYFFIEKGEKAEQKHQQYLAKMRQKQLKTIRRKKESNQIDSVPFIFTRDLR